MTFASIALTDRQRRALAGIGIEVWVRRDLPTVAAVPTAAEVRTELRAEVRERTRLPDYSNASAAAPAIAARLRISLECVAAAGVVVVGECANPLDRRLVNDIVLAIGGLSAQTHKAHFRWPQTQTGDASESAARNAYRAFLRGQIERANARRLLLLGATAQGLLAAEAELGPEVLRLPDVRALRGDPDAKKQLWLSVSHRSPA
jgi:uracil-DNA glycosylase